MPLNKLDNFIKNTEGRILYVSPSDLDATDSITNAGNSLARPFKTLQRALIESARFSYQQGDSNDFTERTTILLMPGEHEIDNRPGLSIQPSGGTFQLIDANGAVVGNESIFLDLNTNFDLSDPNNVLRKLNSTEGGVIVPRGTSIVGLDLRKTKVRPKYVPNPTISTIAPTAMFRITGACYLWQFSVFDGKGNVYTDPTDLTGSNLSNATFSHHKLTVFEYADGVNITSTGLTDLQMYYAKLSNAYNESSTRIINSIDKFPANPEGFEPKRPEFEIVGAFASDPIQIESIEAGSGGTLSNIVTVRTKVDHELSTETPIKIGGIDPNEYNISTLVATVVDSKTFTYLLPSFPQNLTSPGNATGGEVTIETDTVSGASPYVFNISMRSVYGLNGMKADGNKATGFRSMVVAQFTGVSLQKDDRAFVKYNESSRTYDEITIQQQVGGELASESSSTNPEKIYHLDPKAIYRKGFENCHITIANDAIMQIVSVFAIGYNKHFTATNGGDASITNSNSNFGQLALVSEGFKKEAFAKDDKAYLTNIITPRAITETDDVIDWLSLDVGVTTSVGISTHLYLFGFNSKDVKPVGLTQGFRVGAKNNEKLFVSISDVEKEANMLMSDVESSSVKNYSSNPPSDSVLTLGGHNLENGEKIIIQSEVGDLPENIENNQIYFAITDSSNSLRDPDVSPPSLTSSQIQIATSAADAAIAKPLNIFGGSQIRILSRVSDKNVGDLGHPVQFDTTNNNWFVHVNASNNIFTTLNSSGVAGIGERTEPSFIRRTSDIRKIDDKIYKLRVVIPKQLRSSKNPENGFIIQESSTTGITTDLDFFKKDQGVLLTDQNFDFERNPRFISSCTYSEPDATIRTEIPHNLKVGDSVIIKNVTDTTNPNITTVGAATSGYNGTFTVKEISNDLVFKYEPGRNPGAFATNDFNTKNSGLPRFERNNLQSNIYAYRNERISDYQEEVQDGIFHLYPLNAGNNIAEEFTTSKYSQNVTDLYPQLDRDNPNDSPDATKTFANRSPLGKVTTNDLKKSITRETVDKLYTDVGIGISILSVTPLSAGISTLTFTREHGIAGITTATVTGGSGYKNPTSVEPYFDKFHNVKLFIDAGLTSWSGVTATVSIGGNNTGAGQTIGKIAGVEIVSQGSGIVPGDLFFDTSVIGAGSGGKVTVTANQLSPSTENYVQVAGIGTTAGGYFPIASVPSKTSIAIAQTSTDPEIVPFQYAFPAGHNVAIGTAIIGSATGVTTLTSARAHGLVAGNRVQIVSSSGATPYLNYGDYIVKSVAGVGTFSVTGQVKDSISGTLLSEGTPNARVLKHSLSANDASSDSSDENLSVRGAHIFGDEVLFIDSFTSQSVLKVSLPGSLTSIASRFPYGSYIQVDDEIMRISKATVTAGNEITVIRGALGTRVDSHDNGSLARKINPIAIEFRRPSVLRASGHTFEYLGYGPGNYSTALPQLQTVSLTEKEEFLSQAQEKSAGAVVYTGMNDKGDFYIGNQKKSSLTGEETTFDTPVPTVTGEDAGRLSVVFDEVTIKERLIVEGGDSSQVLSQLDGPTTFNNEVRVKSTLNVSGKTKFSDTTEATSPTDASVVFNGGVGVNGKLNTKEDIIVSGDGKIGIGITNPQRSLHIQSTGDTLARIQSADGFAAFLELGDESDPDGGRIVYDRDSNLEFYTESIGRLRIDSDGNLGINTIAPNSSELNTDARVLTINGPKRGVIELKGEIAEADTIGSIRFFSTDNLEAEIKSVADSSFNGDLRFSTNGSERLTIAPNGDINIANNLSVTGDVSATGSLLATRLQTARTIGGVSFDGSANIDLPGVNITGNQDTTGTATNASNVQVGTLGDAVGPHFIFMKTGSGAEFAQPKVDTGISYNSSTNTLSVAGDVIAFASDDRLKTDKLPIDNPLDKVMQIEGFTFNFNEIGSQIYDTSVRHVGVSAQQIQKVLPEAVVSAPINVVNNGDSDYLTVKYEKLVPLLIEAIKELNEKVEKLEQKLSDK